MVSANPHSNDYITVFIGPRKSGKSTMIHGYMFKDKEDTPKPTTTLDYKVSDALCLLKTLFLIYLLTQFVQTFTRFLYYTVHTILCWHEYGERFVPFLGAGYSYGAKTNCMCKCTWRCFDVALTSGSIFPWSVHPHFFLQFFGTGGGRALVNLLDICIAPDTLEHTLVVINLDLSRYASILSL